MCKGEYSISQYHNIENWQVYQNLHGNLSTEHVLKIICPDMKISWSTHILLQNETRKIVFVLKQGTIQVIFPLSTYRQVSARKT